MATPGLLNHLTGTLEDLDVAAGEADEKATLMRTIRCPRNLGAITERLPAAQYSPLKRSKSLAIEIGEENLQPNQQKNKSDVNLMKERLNKLDHVTKQVKSSKAQEKPKRNLGSLPTIQEDDISSEKETLDKYIPQSKPIKVQYKQKEVSKVIKRVDALMKYNSDTEPEKPMSHLG